MRFTQVGDICTSAQVNEPTFKHICSLPLVHRPKGTLLLIYLSETYLMPDHEKCRTTLAKHVSRRQLSGVEVG